jgi:hypothetical protein
MLFAIGLAPTRSPAQTSSSPKAARGTRLCIACLVPMQCARGIGRNRAADSGSLSSPDGPAVFV